MLSLQSEETRTVAMRLFAVAALALAVGQAVEVFGTMGNLLTILRQASLLFLIASGLTLVVIAGGLDLSVGANVSLSACLAGAAIKATGSPAAGFAIAAACGALIGLANAVVVGVLRVPAFVATYGMMWILHGVAYWFMGGASIYGFAPGFRHLGTGFAAGVPIPVYIMVVFLILGTLFAQRTVWGQQIYAIGANPTVAHLSGVPMKGRVALVYVVSGLMSGLAAIVYLARLNSADAELGDGLTLQAIAAVLIGGTSLFGGSGTLAGTLLGCLLLAVVLNAMNLLAVSASWQPIVTGAIVIASVLFDGLVRRNR